MHTVICSKHKTQSVSVNAKLECIRCVMEERDSLVLQLSEALKSCPWATHATNHTEPKHCIAALHSQCEILGDERRGLAEQLKESNRLNGELVERCAKIAEDFGTKAGNDAAGSMAHVIAQAIRKQTEKR